MSFLQSPAAAALGAAGLAVRASGGGGGFSASDLPGASDINPSFAENYDLVDRTARKMACAVAPDGHFLRRATRLACFAVWELSSIETGIQKFSAVNDNTIRALEVSKRIETILRSNLCYTIDADEQASAATFAQIRAEADPQIWRTGERGKKG